MLALSLTIIVTLLASASAPEPKFSSTLRFVNLVFRHGERTPADTYPTDPHKNIEFYPFGWGQLTNAGKMQQFVQGKWLQARYGEFLGQTFTTRLARVESTGVDRTIMSAQLAMAGLFPPVGSDRWNEDLDWQPVPIHYEPLDHDSLLLVRVPCPRYYEELSNVMNSGEVIKRLEPLDEMYSYLSAHTNMTIANPDDVQSLYNTLYAEVLFNLTLPEWTSKYFPHEMAAVTAYSFTLNVFNDELQKLKGGLLLKRILENMDDKIANPGSEQKMSIYAGHDSTIANVMSALKVWDEQIPVYNIMALIELHEINQEYGIKVYLRNSTDVEPYLLTIPGCEQFCPMSQVVELTRGVIPQNFEEECKSHDSSFIPPPPSGP